MKPESIARLRQYFRDYPEPLVDLVVKVTDEFYDMHISNDPHRPFIEQWERKARGAKKVEFLIPEVILFFGKAAGEDNVCYFSHI